MSISQLDLQQWFWIVFILGVAASILWRLASSSSPSEDIETLTAREVQEAATKAKEITKAETIAKFTAMLPKMPEHKK